MNPLRRWFGGWFGNRRAEARMEEEFQFHIDMETDRLTAQGLPREEAHRRALARFGGMDVHREAMRDGRADRWFGDALADLRYALRMLRRNPGYALAVTLILGIGVGMNGVVFGFVNALLLRPVVSHHPDRLVALFAMDRASGEARELAWDDFKDFRDRSGAFAGLAGMSGVPVNLAADSGSPSGASRADMVWAEMVTENYFAVLGMEPAAGTFFNSADAVPGAGTRVVLNYETWQRRFHGDPSVIGRAVRVNGAPFTIAGVAAPGFKGLRTFGYWPELWVPVGMHEVVSPGSSGLLSGRGPGWMMVFGRMQPGWDLTRTGQAADLFARQLAAEYPAFDADRGAMVLSARAGFDHPAFTKPAVLVLISSLAVLAGLITLLIICANLANLALARMATRSNEIATRLSVGCSRGRLVRQLLVEALVVAIPGMVLAAGIVMASGAVESRLTPHLQFQVGFRGTPDYRVALFTALAGLVAVVLSGLVPALLTGRATVRSVAFQAASGSRTVTHSARLRSVLVVVQFALSVVLLVAGVLFMRSLDQARSVDLGFEPHQRVTVSVNVGLQRYDESRGQRFYQRVLDRVREMPGAVSAAWSFPMPFDTEGRGIRFYVEGVQGPAKDGTIGADLSVVSADFIPALGLRLESGRGFTPGDSAGAPSVMVVTRSLAKRLWPGRDPVGMRAHQGGADAPTVTVVGVVADPRYSFIGDAGAARAYLPLAQNYREWETLLVQVRDDPMASIAQLRDVIAAIDPALPAFGAGTMDQNVSNGLNLATTGATVAGFFSLVALFIAAVGLYAMVAGNVNERGREIGVRLALGATPARVRLFLMRQGTRMAIVGVVIGISVAVGVSRVLANLLFGLGPGDPVTFVAVPLILAVVVLLATYLPAHRATRRDPVKALRAD